MFPTTNVWINFMAANDLCYTSTTQYRANLQTWIDAVKAAGHIPVLIHPTWGDDPGYCPQNIPAFITVIDGLVASNNLLPAIPLYEATLNQIQDIYLPPDVHLSHAGCAVWQQTIAAWPNSYLY